MRERFEALRARAGAMSPEEFEPAYEDFLDRGPGAPVRPSRATGPAAPYALTVFTPIAARARGELRDVLDALPVGRRRARSRALDGLHFTRLQVFADLVHQGPRSAARRR